MPHAAPRADAALPAVRDPAMWVLIQTAPRLAVLATSPSRERLVAERSHLFDADPVRLIDPDFEVIIAGANHLAA